jgi:hypothetical protein
MPGYELMHKDRLVAGLEISISQSHNVFVTGMQIVSHEHMPTGTTQPTSLKCKPEKLKSWISDRAIPTERAGLRRIVDEFGLPHPNLLLLDSLALSLSDQYWIRPSESGISWDSVNFFRNGFSNDLGDVLLGDRTAAEGMTFVSPDASCCGLLPKKWIIRDGRRILMKGGKLPYFQEPLNEATASRVMEALGVPHVDYDFATINGRPYSLCETFVDADTDFVSAYYIADMLSNMPANVAEKYDFFLGWCGRLGIPDVKSAMDRIFVVDFILSNTDRHFNNFGALRDAVTLEWKGMSPIFDTGNCLWNEHDNPMIRQEDFGECVPFRKNFRSQLRLVSDFSWVDLSRLKTLPDDIAGMFIPTDKISKERIDRIRQALEWRVTFLENAIRNPALLREKSRRPRNRR